MSFPTIFPLADLNGRNGFVINGIAPGDRSGRSVSSAGDINGDGFDDIIIGVPSFSSPFEEGEFEEAYVVFGSSQGFNPSLNLSDLNGSNGFIINGLDPGDNLGESVSGAGDINGDGFDDIIIGAPWADQDGPVGSHGEAYVIFGSNQGFSPSFNLSGLNGSNGFVFNGIDGGDWAGSSVSSAGDVNGDGLDDILISASWGSRLGGGVINGAIQIGHTYVVFGRQQGFDPSLDLFSLNGSNGFTILGAYHTALIGSWVSSAGDINGDGFDDILIGAESADPNGTYNAGATYVVFGKAGGFNSTFELSSLNGSNGFTIHGIAEQDYSGGSVSSAGDINGDGFDDILIGASSANPNGEDSAGQAYVVFGSNQGFSSTLELSSLNGSNGFAINGEDASDSAGWSVSTAGDINGDGFDDILVGARLANVTGKNASLPVGATYVIYGTSQGFGSSLDLSSITNGDGSKGFVIDGSDSLIQIDMSVSAAGDVNGDGFDDILVGDPDASSNGNSTAGATYVVFGRASFTAIEWNTQTSVVSTFGISLNSNQASTTPIGRTITDTNWQLQTTGDLNGDGQDDIILRHALAGQNLAWTMAPGGQSIQSEAIIGRDVPDLNWSIAGTGDFNADGNIDLIWRNQAADQIVAWYMDGNGNIQNEALVGRSFGDNNWKIEAVADFNGDNKSDLVLRNSLSGDNLLWEMDGATILAESLIGRNIADQSWHIEGAKDFDNNGTTDLFLRNRSLGQGLLWSMADKNTIASEQLISNVPTGTSQLVF